MRQRHHSPRTATAAWLLHCALLSILPACQPQGSDPPFDAYLATLAAALSLRAPNGQDGRVPPSPPPDSMHLPIAASNLEGIDILALRGCAVQRNIIRRDTSLGRLAKPSQHLLLTLEYLRLAPHCIRQLRRNGDALAEQMHDAWQQQRAQLPALVFNATLGGAEFAAFWRAAPVQGGYPRVDTRETTAALLAIDALAKRWLRGDYRADDRDFELWLAAVAGGTGGAQWEALSRRANALAVADTMLMRHGARAMRCSDNPRQRPTAKLAPETSAAFTLDVQPRYARALRGYRELLRPVADLEAQLGATLPPPYRRWMEDRNRSLAALGAAPQRHLQQIAQLPQACATQ